MRVALGLGVVASGGLWACGHAQIAGTSIDDTPDNRGIIKVIGRYKEAFEARNAQGVLETASPKFYETNGTADPADDYDYNGLKKTLADQFAKINYPSLDIDVRRIEIANDDATVNVFFSSRYQMVDAGANAGFKVASDVSQIHLRKENGDWKITSGI